MCMLLGKTDVSMLRREKGLGSFILLMKNKTTSNTWCLERVQGNETKYVKVFCLGYFG